ncbi:MAG: OmpH family outer membrane protein [Deltaproteobacteria bacterium]|nr:OmpH family outer membrane protein [Deltaproteobacteria bacterium]
MKRIFMGVLISLFFPFGSAFASDNPSVRIGYIDVQQVLQSVNDGKAAKAKLEKEFNAKKEQLQKEQDKLRKLSEELEKQSLVLSETGKEEKRKELQAKMLDHQNHLSQAQMEMKQREEELMSPIFQKMDGIIRSLAEKNKYTLILEKTRSAILFGLEKDDLTKELVAEYNKRHPVK